MAPGIRTPPLPDRSFVALSVLLLLTSCTDPGDSGRLRLSIADAPVDHARRVVVEVTAVEVESLEEDARIIPLPEPRSIDLLALQGGQRALLLDLDLAPGTYRSLALHIRAVADERLDSYVELENGATRELHLPANETDALRVIQDFRIRPGSDLHMTIDFDLRSSIHPGGSDAAPLELRPRLRLVEDRRAGAIAGRVDPGLVSLDCTPAVYVYEGRQLPDDVDGRAPEPVNSGRVGAPASDAYHIDFLPEGEYSVAFTCNADRDDPGRDDPVAFSDPRQAAVSPGRTTTVNFSAEPPVR